MYAAAVLILQQNMLQYITIVNNYSSKAKWIVFTEPEANNCFSIYQTLQDFAMLRFATSTQHQPITANWVRCRNFNQPPQLSRKFDQSVASTWTDVDKLPSALLPCLLRSSDSSIHAACVRLTFHTCRPKYNCERSRKAVSWYSTRKRGKIILHCM